MLLKNGVEASGRRLLQLYRENPLLFALALCK